MEGFKVFEKMSQTHQVVNTFLYIVIRNKIWLKDKSLASGGWKISILARAPHQLCKEKQTESSL